MARACPAILVPVYSTLRLGDVREPHARVLICISMYNYVLCLYLYVSAGIGMYSNNTSEKWLSTKTSIGLYQHVLPYIFVYCTCIDMYRSVCMLYVPAPEPRVWIVPVTSILGRLPLVPVGDAGTIPFSMASHKQQCFPGGTCDRADAPGSGSKLFYINTWAMVWPSDHPVLAE